MNEIINRAEFAATVKDALSVVSHIWQQLEALRSRLDDEISQLFRRLDFANPTAEEEDRVWGERSCENVCEQWLWRYRVSAKGLNDARKTEKGYLHVLTRISPRNSHVTVSEFEPFVVLNFGVCREYDDKCDEYLDPVELQDLGSSSDGNGYKYENTNYFGSLPGALAKSYSDDKFWGYLMYIPLVFLDANHLQERLLAPLERLLLRLAQNDWSR